MPLLIGVVETSEHFMQECEGLSKSRFLTQDEIHPNGYTTVPLSKKEYDWIKCSIPTIDLHKSRWDRPYRSLHTSYL